VCGRFPLTRYYTGKVKPLTEQWNLISGDDLEKYKEKKTLQIT
jgi:hypothetical protein